MSFHVSSVSPAYVEEGEMLSSVLVSGTDFTGPVTLHVGSWSYTANNPSSSGFTAFNVALGLSPGSYAVTVENGDSTTLAPVVGSTFTVAAHGPMIQSVTPKWGLDPSGGEVLNVYGNYFDPGALVYIGGQLCPSITVNGTGHITVTTPPGSPGQSPIEVKNPDGQYFILYVNYAVSTQPAPTVTGISPGTFPESGGPGTITGTGFQPGATVTICTVPSTNVQVISSTQITVTIPPHINSDSVDYCPIIVTNPDGQFGTLNNGVAYEEETLDAPTITGGTGIAPNTGIETGGTAVTITGTGFQNGATVTFGGTAATSVVFVSSTQLNVVTPAHAPGAVDVVVTNPDTQSVTESGGFTFVAAAVNPPSVGGGGLNPTSGPETGGTTVVITGADFVDCPQVLIAGAIPAASVTFDSATQLTIVTPPHSPAAVTFTIINPDGQSCTTPSFEFTAVAAGAPTISGTNGISPNEGDELGGTLVTISGTNFQAGATVTFDGTEGTVTHISATTIQVLTPPHVPEVIDVVVTNPDTQSVTATDGFEYIHSPPVISDITPDTLDTNGGTATITGTGFEDGLTVTVCGTAVTVDSVTQTTIEITIPSGITPATCDVVVTNPDGQDDTVTGGFTVTAIPGPVVTGVYPDEVPCFTNPGMEPFMVALTGTGFQDGATVTVCGVSATVHEVQPTMILFFIPDLSDHCGEDCDVVVTNPDGLSTTVVGVIAAVHPSELLDTCPLQAQTVLTGLKSVRKKGEVTFVLPEHDTLEEALENCLQPGDLYRTSGGVVMIVPGLDFSWEDGV